MLLSPSAVRKSMVDQPTADQAREGASWDASYGNGSHRPDVVSGFARTNQESLTEIGHSSVSSSQWDWMGFGSCMSRPITLDPACRVEMPTTLLILHCSDDTSRHYATAGKSNSFALCLAVRRC